MIKKILKFVFLAPMALCGLTALFFWAYFGYKANQPMQVEEAQRIAPGITFNEFMADRKELYQEVDAQASKKTGFCMIRYNVGLPQFTFNASLDVIITHFHPELEDSRRQGWHNVFPPDEVLYGFLPDAMWWEVENWNWYFAQNHATCNPRPVRRPGQQASQ